MEGAITHDETAGKAEAVPTTTLPEVEKTMNVLVAIDDSDESFNALQWVLEKILTKRGSESKVVTIVHVTEPLPRYVLRGGHVMESANKAQEQNASRILSRAYEMCKERTVNAKTLVLEGDPKDKICRAVEEMNINLLAIGSRGLGQIKRAFLGSVSDYCAHHAKCPVLVVRPPPKKTS